MNNSIREIAEQFKTVIIYGAGVYGRRVYFDLKTISSKILFAESKIGRRREYRNIPIFEIAELVDYRNTSLVIVGVSESIRDELAANARKLGFGNVITPNIQLNDYEYWASQGQLDIEQEIKEWYEVYTGEVLNTMEPRSYNEKIQWLKINDSTPQKGKLSDKYEVREYVKSCIGDKYLNEIYGVWNDFDLIDFEQLPERFVLKCTHGSGTNAIITSKRECDVTKLRENFIEWLKYNYAYQCGLEMHYKYIKPRIIAEKYIESEDGNDLRDYKIHVFNGKAKLIQVDIDRAHVHRRNLYDIEWNYLPYTILYPSAPNVTIEKPECFEEMIDLAEKLASDFIYVRVDFYIVKEQIIFGELTFTHGSGVEPFVPEEFNYEMGSWMQLPNKK